jgi:hypothetical protein
MASTTMVVVLLEVPLVCRQGGLVMDAQNTTIGHSLMAGRVASFFTNVYFYIICIQKSMVCLG